jgi:signal transduction histidine kinase
LDKVNDFLKIEIGKQKEYEIMLQQSLEKEKELNEMKSRFISTTSHEFRTPLTSVLLSADLMKLYGHSWSESKKNEYFDKIKNSVIYLTKLLDDMLTLSRTESGKINYNPEPVDLSVLAGECIDDGKSLITARHELNLSFESNQKEFILDPKLMRFILSNLISNAVKFSPDGGEVKLKIDSGADNILIEISDMGIGIPPEDINKIFESFYRTKNAELMTGTGLGLAIVKRAVELHNGEIAVTSELNKGTTFYIKIPIGN